jgi:hypothetical protein
VHVDSSLYTLEIAGFEKGYFELLRSTMIRMSYKNAWYTIVKKVKNRKRHIITEIKGNMLVNTFPQIITPLV